MEEPNAQSLLPKKAQLLQPSMSPRLKLNLRKNSQMKTRFKFNFMNEMWPIFLQIADKSQDIVFSACALGYIDDLLGCFKEVHRVLKDDGIFVWSVGHPFYNVIDSKTFQLRESYLDTGIKIEGDFANVLRTVSDYFTTATGAGFVVEKMIEPDSRKHYPHDPWYGLWDYSPELLAKVPATLIFKCRKK